MGGEEERRAVLAGGAASGIRRRLGAKTRGGEMANRLGRLGEQGRTAALALNLFIPLACGLAAAALGRVIGQAL